MRIVKAQLMLNCPKSGLIPRSECKPKNVEGGCQHLHYYSISTYDIECSYKPVSKQCGVGRFYVIDVPMESYDYGGYCVEWEILFKEPCPYTKEEWEREIKGKTLFELLPETTYDSSTSTKTGEENEI